MGEQTSQFISIQKKRATLSQSRNYVLRMLYVNKHLLITIQDLYADIIY